MTCAAEWRIASSVACGAGVEQLVRRAALGRLELLFDCSASAIATSCSAIRLASMNHETSRPRQDERLMPPAVPPAFAARTCGPTLSWPR